jgi:CRISPR-associated protein Csm2
MAYNQQRSGGGPRRDDRRDDRNDVPPLDTSGIVLKPPAGGSLNPALFDDEAAKLARVLASNRDRNKPAQIRQFYDELVMWEEKVRQAPSRFAEFLPFVRMLNAKAAYALGRKHVDDNFLKFIGDCVRQVDDELTLSNFKLFFEAFLGFYKLERPSG